MLKFGCFMGLDDKLLFWPINLTYSKMKRIAYLAAVLLALVGCKKDPQVQKVSVTGITLNPTALSIPEGGAKTISATVSPSDATNKLVLWSTDNSSVATVSSDGTVKAQEVGTATITAKSDDGGLTATCTVTVKPRVPLTGISIDPTSLTLTEGETGEITVTFTPANASYKTLSWTSSDPSVATVSEGTVTAIKSGKTTITVTSEDGGFTAKCEVLVKVWQAVDITGITLSPDPLEVRLAETEPAAITAEITPANATNKTLLWTSSDPSVATVSPDGTVTAVHIGDCKITAMADDGSGVEASCWVFVLPPLGAVDMGIRMTREDGTKYNLFWAESNLGASVPKNPGYYFAWGETEPKEIYTWTNYKWRNSESGPFSKYDPNSSDENVNKSVLDPEDDAAHVMLGGKWRMPTDAEWAELVNKCWNKQYENSGLKIHASGDNGSRGTDYIFLPDGGYKSGNKTHEDICLYWSSSLDTSDPSTARSLVFFNDSKAVTYPTNRSYGCLIRPVYED